MMPGPSEHHCSSGSRLLTRPEPSWVCYGLRLAPTNYQIHAVRVLFLTERLTLDYLCKGRDALGTAAGAAVAIAESTAKGTALAICGSSLLCLHDRLGKSILPGSTLPRLCAVLHSLLVLCSGLLEVGRGCLLCSGLISQAYL
jgi:hypothetical protein